MARKIREFENDPNRANRIQEYRCAGFLVKTLVEYFEKEKLEDIEKRLEVLESHEV